MAEQDGQRGDWWRELNTPDAFRADWYGELTNQCGHTLLGLAASAIVLAALHLLTGEMPYRWIVAFVVMLPYLAVERFVQGWRFGDSLFDSAMVAFGVAAALVPWKEVEPLGPEVLVRLNVAELLYIIAAWAGMLFFRVQRRYIDAKERQG